MLKQLKLLQTVSTLALVLALPAQAQDTGAEQAPATEATGKAAITAPAEETDATGVDTTAESIDAATEGEASADGEAAAEAAPAEPVTRDTVVASVNGTDITVGEVIVAVRQLAPQYQQLPPDVLFPGVVDQLIQQELLSQTVTEEPPTLSIAIANQRRSMLADEAVSDVLASAVTAEAVRAAYDAQYANAEPTTEWNASHILVATQEEANSVVERLNAGEDFAAVAQEVSTDTGSGAQGGELGWFGPGMMVPEFEQGVQGLEAGALSAPIESQFGWHVIRLNETREQQPPALEEVRAEIESQLQQEAVQARIAELEESAEVTRPAEGQFDPTAVLDPSLLEE